MGGSCRGGVEACDGGAVAVVALMKLVRVVAVVVAMIKLVMVGAVAVGGVVWW